MVDGDAGDEEKGAGGQVVIRADAADGRVGVDAREDGVGVHGEGSLSQIIRH